MPNRLAGEPSPYLRQHAENPVDWYPWGPDAFAAARAGNKPILLSIGYAACHWCHVMAHESFEDPATARLMNERFISVKVDREERPDVDGIYMQAVQALTGQGGWPMTVFLTPEAEPFWGGTYFPPEERHGLPSFRRVLTAVADAYSNRSEQVTKTVAAMRDLYETAAQALPAGELGPSALERAFRSASQAYDQRSGGFGAAPKFPPTMLLEFLLTHWSRTGQAAALEMARHTFSKMADGGIHDQVGGGIHRYAVDQHWLVPHFEKMLYDNALLARFGAHLWQATADDGVRETTEGILRWVAREMTSDEGGFFASLDADSEGHEGLFYTWTAAEFDELLGPDAPVVRAYFDVTTGGNFEGRNILHIPGGVATTAARTGVDPAEVAAAVARAIPRLYAARAQRVWPGLDDKVVAGWNGLMLRAVAVCARVFHRPEWRELALRNAEFLAREFVRDDRVARIWSRGEARGAGFLEDHAAIALGFLDVWSLTHDRVWLDRARGLAASIGEWFWDDALPGFYDVAHDHERLITRPRDLFDNATPSGSALAIELFLRLSSITGDTVLADRARQALAPLAESMARHPHGHGHLLAAADIEVHGPTTLAVVGDPDARAPLVARAGASYLPSAIIAASREGEHGDLALFEGRDARGAGAAAYLCRGTVCGAPATTAAELDAQLAAFARPVSPTDRAN